MHPFESKTLLSGLAAFALVLGASTFASAQTSSSSKTDNNRYTYVPFAGQSVAIDRQTGKLRPPTPDEARHLGAALKNYLNRSSQGLVVKTHPNGMQSVDLQGRFQSVSLAKINPDGSTSERCVTNMREANDFLTGSPPKKNATPRSSSNGKASHVEEK